MPDSSKKNADSAIDKGDGGGDRSTGAASTHSETSMSQAARMRARQRRRLDRVFGNDLPDVTRDDRDEAHKGDVRGWYESQRPPHYE